MVPCTLLSLLACVPLLYVASRVDAATNIQEARAQVRLAWLLGGSAWACQLWLVAGVAPAVRSVSRGAPLSQWRAFARGLCSLVRGDLWIYYPGSSRLIVPLSVFALFWFVERARAGVTAIDDEGGPPFPRASSCPGVDLRPT